MLKQSKRFIGIFLMLALVLAMIPAFTTAASAAGDIHWEDMPPSLTQEDNEKTIIVSPAAEGALIFPSDVNEITLSGTTEGTSITNVHIEITNLGDVTLTIENLSIFTDGGHPAISYGGSGTLTLNLDNVTFSGGIGIDASAATDGTVLINASGEVCINGGNSTFCGDGIRTAAALKIYGNVFINCENTEAYGGRGIYVADTGDIEIYGNVTAFGGGTGGIGVRSDSNILIAADALLVASGSIGLLVENDIHLSGSLTATAASSGLYGIATGSNGSVYFNHADATLTAGGGDSEADYISIVNEAGDSYQFYKTGDVDISEIPGTAKFGIGEGFGTVYLDTQASSEIIWGGSVGGGVKNSTINPNAAAPARNETGVHEDIVITLTANGNTLKNLIYSGKDLVRDRDYTVSGNSIIIKGAFLDTLAEGEHIIRFDMSGGSDPALTLTISEQAPDFSEWENPFIDVFENDWFYDDVEFVYKNGLVSGTSANTFSPLTNTTRGMIATILGRLAKIDPADYSKASFSDVDENAYYAPYIAWAAETGIVKGVGGGNYEPDVNISRQELAVVLSRYAEKMNLNMKQIPQTIVFADSEDIADYARDSVSDMARAGVIFGRPGGVFDPLAEATRAEVAAMLHRFAGAAGID